MASKLTDITTSYDLFVPDQVLTADQLNKFINYFEDQDRLSRICLSGVGIVCGFEVSFDPGKPLITVSQGAGVTTDADLINLRKAGSSEPLKSIDLPEINYTHFLDFQDDNAYYDKFVYNGNQLQLWKLYTSNESDGSPSSPQPLSSFPGNLDDMVVMLYLESYEDESDLCDGLDCDNQGIHQVFELHALLIHRTDALQMLKDDEVFDKHELMTTYMKMKDLSVQRVLMQPSNTSKVADLIASYALAKEGALIGDLKSGLTALSDKIDPYVEDNLLPGVIAMLDQKLAPATNPPQLFFQYRHDLLRDIVDTYNELKELFVRITTECMPSIHAFPKHLMLGRLSPTDEDQLTSRFRHKWYASMILRDRPEFDMVGALIGRLADQLSTYPQLPETELKNGLLRPQVRITPSRYRSLLGVKAIPFYYNLTDSLLRHWNFEKTAYGKHRRNYSYNTLLLDPAPDIQTPLAYNLEPSNFLRIEGGQGRDYKAVMAEISDLKIRYGLSFDVKAIGIDIDPSVVIDMDTYECEFEDLSVLLKAWVNEQECMLASVASILSAYSLKQPGYNKREAIYTPRVSQYVQQSQSFGGTVGMAGASVETSGLKTNLGDLKTASPQASAQQAVSAENKATFGTNSSVVDHLTVDEDTVGYAFIQALTDNVYSSANDLITNGNYYAEQITLQPGALPWEPIQYVSLVDNTLQILAYAHILSNSIPTSIAGITDEVIANYKKNIDNLCVIVKRVQVSHTSDHTLSDKNSAILKNLTNQLIQLCCGSEQLKALLTEIDRRKDNLLSRLTLRKFCEEHPGLEHFGGVEPGGTFVLIYLNKGVNVPGGELNVPNGTVVADFSLPYMCCSDCSPVAFVVPRPAVRLSLPKSVFCLGNDSSPMTFQVEPSNGVIKADKTIAGMTIVGNQLFIDQNTFPQAYLNQVINFTVNDQITDCQLTVVKPIVADFSVPQSPATNPVVNFSPIGNFPSGTQFVWDFGDGTTSTQKNTTHTYELPVGPTNMVTVRLTVTPPGGACPTIREHDIEFQEVSISIQPTTFCINSGTAYPFTVTPQGASVTIDGPGVDPVSKTFTPNNAFVGEVPIFMNGSEALTLTVNPTPTVNGVGWIENGEVHLGGMSAFGINVYWRFTDLSGQQIHEDVPGVQHVISLDEFPAMEPGTSFYATLWANNLCGVVSQQVTLSIPVDTLACSTDATDDIKHYYDELIAFIGGQVFEGLPEQYKSWFQAARSFFLAAAQEPQPFIAGQRNEQMFDALAPLINEVHAILRDMGPEMPDEERNSLVMLYQWLVSMFLSILQCQNNSAYGEPVISSLFEFIYSHLDPANEESFPARGVVIDPEGTFAAIVLEVRGYRAQNTQAWSYINDIYYLLTQGGGATGMKVAAPGGDPGTAPKTSGTESKATVEAAPAPTAAPTKKTAKKK